MPQWSKTLFNAVTHSRRVWKGLRLFLCVNNQNELILCNCQYYALLCYTFTFQATSPSLNLEAIYVRDLLVSHSGRLREITDTLGQRCLHLEFSFFLTAGGRNCFTALRLTISQNKLPQVWQRSFVVSFSLSLFFLSNLKCKCLHMIMRASVMLACLFLLFSLQTKMNLF